MRRINFRLLCILTLLTSVFAYISFTEAFHRDEGKLGDSGIRIFLADMFNIMRFPSHVIFPRMFASPFTFALGLIFNCILYSFILERIIYLILYLLIYKNQRED